MNYDFKIKKVPVVYSYNHSKMGFNNQITVEAISNEQAIEKAKHEVAMCYGSEMLKKFSFKIK